jgi:hypothetical protein
MKLHILNADIHKYYDQFTTFIDGCMYPNDGEQNLTIPSHVGTGSMNRIRIRPGMEIVIADITFHEDMKLQIQEACPLF